MKSLALFLVLFSPGIEAILKSRSAKPSIIEKPMNLTYNTMKLYEDMSITNEAMIIRVLFDKTHAQRLQIKSKYWELYKLDLIEEVDAKLWWDLRHLVRSMLLDWNTYITTWVRGLLSRPHVQGLLEILSTRNKAELEAINLKYYQMYLDRLRYYSNRNMPDEDIFITYIVQKTREDGVNITQARQDVERLRDSGDIQAKWRRFLDVFTSRSFEQLEVMCDEYLNITGFEIEQVIRDDFSSIEVRDARTLKTNRLTPIHEVLLDIITLAKNPAKFFVNCLKMVLKWPGSKTDLRYFLLTRSELDLHSIREEWDATEETSFYDSIMDRTSGYFREAVLALLEGNNYE